MKNIFCFLVCLFFLQIGLSFAQESVVIDIQTMYSPADNNKDASLKDSTKTAAYPSSRIKKRKNKKANALYEKHGYHASSEMYNTLQKKRIQDVNALARMANSCRINRNTEEAEYWYSRFINETSQPSHYLHYAEVLKSNNNCKEAKVWFDKYRKAMGDTTEELEINDCSGLRLIQEYPQISIVNATNLNSKVDEFSAIPFEDGVLFTSNRKTKRIYQSHDGWTGESFTDLFYAEQQKDGSFKKIKPIAGNLNTPLHEGTATMNSAGTVMFFTRNEKKRAKDESLRKLEILMASKGTDGYWSDAVSLSFNEGAFSNCHPTLSRNSMKIYFSSDRPGGYGGFDLYETIWGKGDWSEPKNLGPEVNTPGHELFPFIAADNKIYFSSNGHEGMGGMDIFMSTQREDASWVSPIHLGKPLNSSKDDFGFYLNEEKEKGFLSSNRNEGEGKDDIYSFKVQGGWPFNQDIFTVRVRVYENETDIPLENVDVVITEKLNAGIPSIEDLESYWVTEDNGSFNFRVRRGNAYLFNIRKDGYMPLKRFRTAEDLLQNANFGLDIEVKRYREFKLRVDEPVENAKLEAQIKNLKTGAVETIPFGKLKEALASLECGYEYEIILYKDGVPVDSLNVKLSENCDTQPLGELTFKIPKTDLANKYFEVNDQLPSTKNPSNWSDENFKEYFLGNKNGDFEPGQVIALRDVFYDFDQYVIRADASLDLERVAALMKQYPGIKITLEAHTDLRGAASYNMELSSRRAQSAREYLIQNGIDASRLKTQGYGEVKPRIPCKNCSEQQHQMNRRTEIRVIEY